MTNTNEPTYAAGWVEPNGDKELRHVGCCGAAKTVDGPVPKLHCAACGKPVQHFKLDNAEVVPVVV